MEKVMKLPDSEQTVIINMLPIFKKENKKKVGGTTNKTCRNKKIIYLK